MISRKNPGRESIEDSGKVLIIQEKYSESRKSIEDPEKIIEDPG